MEETVLHSFLLSVPQAAAIWLIILAVAVITAVALLAPGRRSAGDRDTPGWRDGDTPGSAAAERAWADRYADEVTVAADRAAATARRGRAEWERAQEALSRAWAAFDAADRAARRSAEAAAFPVHDTGCPAAELADRQRYLHRAATAACRRREIGVPELNDILAHRDGWDPRRHPVLQETALRAAVRERSLTAYREAVARERQAWHTAEVAAAALRSLREEACAARLRVGRQQTAGELWWAGQWDTAVADTTVLLPTVTATEPDATVPLPVGRVLPAVPVVAARRSPSPVDEEDVTVPLPAATRPAGAVPAAPLPAEALPVGSLPVGSLPAGSLPAAPMPADALAALQVPTLQLPTVPARNAQSPVPPSPSVPPAAVPSRGVAEQVVAQQVVAQQMVPAQGGAPAVESLREPVAAGDRPGR